jgi:hypothetical protein
MLRRCDEASRPRRTRRKIKKIVFIIIIFLAPPIQSRARAAGPQGENPTLWRKKKEKKEQEKTKETYKQENNNVSKITTIPAIRLASPAADDPSVSM